MFYSLSLSGGEKELSTLLILDKTIETKTITMPSNPDKTQ